MSTYAIEADKFFLPAGPQLGGYLMVEDGVFGAWQADEPACEIKDYSGTWIAPGMVETDFSLVRFDGDRQRADAVYQGLTPLTAADVAEVIGFVASRPPHVDLDQIVIRPRDQASATRAARRPAP